MKKSPQNKIIGVAKKLKALGLYSGDLRKSMTKGRQKYINSIYQKNYYLVERTDEFVWTTVTKKRAESITNYAYKTGRPNGKVRLFFKGQEVHIFKDYVRLIDGVFDEKFFDARGSDIFALAEKEFARLKPDHKITVKIGENAPFYTAFKDYRTFFNYMGGWTPKEIDTDRDDLISQMTIVTVTGKRSPAKKIKYRCQAKTKNNTRCKHYTKNGNKYCNQHSE